MLKSQQLGSLIADRRGLAIAVLAALAVVAVIGIRQALERRANDRVVMHMATEMPRLDTGVQQPVHVTFVGDRQPTLGQAASLKFVLTSGSAGAEVQARITPPDGATISDGRSVWDGRLEYQQVAEIPVSVTFAGDKGGFVHGEVATRLPDGRVFRSATAVFVDPGTPDTPPPEPRTLIEPDGSRLDVVVWKNQ